MQRRNFIAQTAGFGLVAAAATIPDSLSFGATLLSGNAAEKSATFNERLTPPAKGKIPVAVAISEGVTVIDFAGPWEVFQDVHVRDRGGDMEEQMPFQLYTVSEKTEVLTGSGGLKLVPDYTFANAPQPKVVVVPAQRGSEALHKWLRETAKTADITMSVCTGAFQLGKAGLLSGKSATTHHDFLDRFAKAFPDVNVKRGLRFVEGEKISTAGGLSSGIDLALRVVDRYFGRDVAQATATYMEYQSKGWIV
ncbi:MAG TPA: DJ-1/PfpI family protein [Pyrinomonadaceae bacterium]|nr:DJ-1/PfpI family protein [Pyrinomonadaceae bacterium]